MSKIRGSEVIETFISKFISGEFLQSNKRQQGNFTIIDKDCFTGAKLHCAILMYREPQSHTSRPVPRVQGIYFGHDVCLMNYKETWAEYYTIPKSYFSKPIMRCNLSPEINNKDLCESGLVTTAGSEAIVEIDGEDHWIGPFQAQNYTQADVITVEDDIITVEDFITFQDITLDRKPFVNSNKVKITLRDRVAELREARRKICPEEILAEPDKYVLNSELYLFEQKESEKIDFSWSTRFSTEIKQTLASIPHPAAYDIPQKYWADTRDFLNSMSIRISPYTTISSQIQKKIDEYNNQLQGARNMIDELNKQRALTSRFLNTFSERSSPALYSELESYMPPEFNIYIKDKEPTEIPRVINTPYIILRGELNKSNRKDEWVKYYTVNTLNVSRIKAAI